MPQEKALYRENLVRLDTAFPGRELIPAKEVASYIGMDVRTVIAKKDLPKKRMGRLWMVPKTGLASWLA